jgi:hypothetical protein
MDTANFINDLKLMPEPIDTYLANDRFEIALEDLTDTELPR